MKKILKFFEQLAKILDIFWLGFGMALFIYNRDKNSTGYFALSLAFGILAIIIFSIRLARKEVDEE